MALDADVRFCFREYVKLYEVLSIIVTNAQMIPDPRMEGATDTYAVPLDDILAAQKLLDASPTTLRKD